jgi:hypothetical protein
MSSASVDAVADPGGSQMTNVARIVEVVVGSLPPGKSIAFDISIVSSRYLGKWFTN